MVSTVHNDLVCLQENHTCAFFYPNASFPQQHILPTHTEAFKETNSEAGWLLHSLGRPNTTTSKYNAIHCISNSEYKFI